MLWWSRSWPIICVKNWERISMNTPFCCRKMSLLRLHKTRSSGKKQANSFSRGSELPTCSSSNSLCYLVLPLADPQLWWLILVKISQELSRFMKDTVSTSLLESLLTEVISWASKSTKFCLKKQDRGSSISMPFQTITSLSLSWISISKCC